jgi:hypothetical protein
LNPERERVLDDDTYGALFGIATALGVVFLLWRITYLQNIMKGAVRDGWLVVGKRASIISAFVASYSVGITHSTWLEMAA